MGETFNDDSIIIDILEKNLGRKNAQKVFKTLSDTYDTDSIILELQKKLTGKIPETRLEKMLKDFSDAKTILPETNPETSVETNISKTSTSTVIGSEPKMYDIKDELGRGGMGAVHRVVDLSFDRDIAMKTIIGSPSDDKVKRFIIEAKITGQLEHPNIIPVHDHGINSDGKYYFTMKQVKGEELKDIIKGLSKGEKSYCEKYTLNKQMQIFNRILDGVGFAHSKQIIHRDLKPANIMVGEFGEVQIMDWGLAKNKSKKDIISEEKTELTEEGLTLDGQVMGSPGFMAPEQADGRTEDIDEQSDIWSLGAILYNMLSFKKPIEGNSIKEFVMNTAMGKIVPLKERKNVPKELDSIVMKCLNPEKEERYQNVATLQKDVSAFLEKRSVSAHKYTFLQKINKWIQRHPTTALSGSIAAFLLLTGVGIGSFLYKDAELANLRADEEAKAKKSALVDRDAAKKEVKWQQKSEAILNSIKFLRRDEGFYDAKLSIIKKAVDSSKEYWKPYLVLAKHQAEHKKYDDAENNFRLSNEVYKKQFRKDSIEILFEAGMFYGLPWIIGGKGDAEKALPYFEKVMSLSSDDVFCDLSNLAAMVIRTEEEKTTKYLPKIDKLSKELCENSVARSIDATYILRAYSLGIGVFGKSRGRVFKKYMDLQGAKNALLRIVDEDDGDINLLNFLAALYDEIGDQEKAIIVYSNILKNKKSEELKNFMAGIHIQRGDIFRRKGDLEKAIKDFDDAIKTGPEFAPAYYGRGKVNKTMGKFDKAINDFSMVIKKNKRAFAAYRERGIIYLDRNEFQKAVNDFNEVIGSGINDGLVYANRAIGYMGLNKLNYAQNDINKALSLRFNPAYILLGNLHTKKGEFNQAKRIFEDALKKMPQYKSMIDEGMKELKQKIKEKTNNLYKPQNSSYPRGHLPRTHPKPKEKVTFR